MGASGKRNENCKSNKVNGNDIEGNNNAIHITHNYSLTEAYIKDFLATISKLVSENMKLHRKIAALERKLKAAEKQLAGRQINDSDLPYMKIS